LLFHNAEEAGSRFGLTADYRSVIRGIIDAILEESSWDILLVPHVMTASGHFESDFDACEHIRRSYSNPRIAVVPAVYDESEIKWIIARSAWFCGTRMHATIAALSSCVPTFGLAYSGKMRGVFESCASGEHVCDLRRLTVEAVVRHARSSWRDRDVASGVLRRAIPAVTREVDSQSRAILRAVLEEPAESRVAAG
jgi:polysaccharide pyruvyl transferase WcaK-like protein